MLSYPLPLTDNARDHLVHGPAQFLGHDQVLTPGVVQSGDINLCILTPKTAVMATTHGGLGCGAFQL